MQVRQVVTEVSQVTQGEVHCTQVDPLKTYPVIQDKHEVADPEQVTQGEVHAGQVEPLR
jgi:hypothetical protein